jgi:RsiW-degrading membrane proteinase PrsW (M82 family)
VPGGVETAAAGRPAFGGHQRQLVIVAWAIFGAVALLCLGLLLSELNEVVGPRAFIFGVIFAMAPAPFLVALFYLLDRVRPEPTQLMAVALIWGMCIATYLALRVNGWFGHLLGPDDGTPVRNAVFVAPWVEETAKGLVIFVIVWWQRHRLMSTIGGVVYGGLVGVGFAFTENIVYYSAVFQQALASSRDRSFALDAVQDLFWWRGVAAPFVHPMFTVLTGLGIGFAVRQRNTGVRVLAPVAGFLAAVLLHMSYNTLASYANHRGLTAAYLGILLPLLLVVALVVLRVRRHERRVIAARLDDYVTMGLLGRTQVDSISTREGRRAAVGSAKYYGQQACQESRDLQRDGLELGALRDRIVRGLADQSEQKREAELLTRLRAAGRSIPPASPPGPFATETASFGSHT